VSFYRFAHALVVGTCRAVFRVRLHGAERVPPAGAYVIAPTHRSILDIPFAATITHRRVRFMGKKELWESRLGGSLFTALGGFPVDRDAGAAAVRAALACLDDGEPVVVFPEGTRRHGRDVVDLHEGAAYLAVKADVPVVPIGIGGSEEILASGKVVPRLRRVAVVVGSPLTPRVTTSHDARAEVRRLTSELTTELQRLFDQAASVV
jgi:1-acyl-sn-glycerol-3-phosphate acyltransferase